MKIAGKSIKGPNKMSLVFPRGDDDFVVLWFQAVLKDSEFEKLCPPPKPPMVTKRGADTPFPDFNDKGYKEATLDWGKRKANWLIITSLKATEGLEWDTINHDDPNTWNNLESELSAAGFADIEIQRIVAKCWEVNSLSEDKLEEARQRFIRSQVAREEILLSLTGEQQNMPPGVPASVSA